MKNSKGQALVEFIIIIPVLILIISAMIDFGNIIYQKYKLENDLDTIVDMYKLNKENEINEYVSTLNANIEYNNDTRYTKIILKKDININTIILNNIIGNIYEIEVDRTIIKGDTNG